MPPPLMRFPNAHALPSIFPPVLPDMSPDSIAAAASAYRQPAPPPQLPLLQLPGRHQEPLNRTGDASGPSCPVHRRWPDRGVHNTERTANLSDDELETIVEDVAVLVRREYDTWVESCWTEAFHHVFTRTIPTFIISLILAGASPSFMRRQIVHGGPALDQIFMADMLDHLYAELERRLSGRLVPADLAHRGESSAMATAAAAIGAGGLGAQPNVTAGLPRDGVCAHDLGPPHGAPGEDDDHARCLCQLLACPDCLHAAVAVRKAPVALLPFELADSPVAEGWAGQIETQAQAREREERSSLKAGLSEPVGVDALPSGQGFVHNPKRAPTPVSDPRRPPIFAHPQMTDVLAVEEHLRWRLKELGAADPSVESRYGPSTNAAAALEGLEAALNLDDDDGSEAGAATANGGKNGGRKMTSGRTKARLNKTVKVPPKVAKPVVRKVYLPQEWAEADPAVRNMAVVLTFRHFVKLLHKTATTTSPFTYGAYAADIEALQSVHPVALYRRLTEAAATRKGRPLGEGRKWVECMDKWTEEFGAREKAAGNVSVNNQEHANAVDRYTRAISLDGKKTVYYSNRAVAHNHLGNHELAELDCQHILNKDAKNSKAFYQRAVARKGLQRWRDAEADLKQVLRLQPGNEAAKNLLAAIKPEVAKLPRQRLEDVLNF
ncbi:Outer envelope protein 64, mitochondrial [Vanrija pseudolonga]|uniref:Outer envelope protein 64, mitochondrial n=1 Tax=Vanrija pseudolonga TaxID=143232 RepID=A0AAF0Y6L1_9TREE|nr:Outer envelope protein 64, mitochondrial [Vanrija pseudolonga]